LAAFSPEGGPSPLGGASIGASICCAAVAADWDFEGACPRLQPLNMLKEIANIGINKDRKMGFFCIANLNLPQGKMFENNEKKAKHFCETAENYSRDIERGKSAFWRC
jgi:hypothetical protein